MKKFNFHTHQSREKKLQRARFKDETASSANISQQELFICQLIKISTNIALSRCVLKKYEWTEDSQTPEARNDGGKSD